MKVLHEESSYVFTFFLHKFKLGHNFVSWQCSAISYSADAAEAHWLKIWDLSSSNIFSKSLIHRKPFFQASGHFFYGKKKFYSKEVESAFKDFLASKPLQF